MGDVYCAICGEPWDYYGAKHGDMEPEEFEKFMKGKGCPCCHFGERCPACDGTGKERCERCFGRGYWTNWFGDEPQKFTCEVCGGDGFLETPCPKCGGTGKPKKTVDGRMEQLYSILESSDEPDLYIL